jgi:uncharacterized Fe-S cluster-containing radical SAM superfamily enzyme
MAKPKKPPPEPNPLVLEAMRPVIDVALRFGPKVREHIVYRGSREWMMTAEDPREATRLERAEAERLAVGPRQVVQLVEASDGRLVAEGAVWAAMVVGPDPAVKGPGAFVA